MTKQMTKHLIPLLYLVFLLPSVATAKDKIEDLTRLVILQESIALEPGQTTHLGLKVQLLKPGWHTYWKNPGDSGAAPKVKLKANQPLEMSGLLYPVPERIETKTLISFAYENEVLYLLPLRLSPETLPGQKLRVTLEFEWLVCQEICIPARETRDLEWTLTQAGTVTPSAEAPVIEKALAALPLRRGVQGVIANDFKAQFDGLPAQATYVDFFAAPDAGVSLKKPPGSLQNAKAQLQLAKADFADGTPKAAGLLLMKNARGERLAYEWAPEPEWREAETVKEPAGFQPWMLLLAFVGGLILNLMPCVLPVLSLKLLSLAKQSNLGRAQVRFENLAYTAGVLVSFVGMGLTLLALRAAGEKLGWGFQLQSPIFLAFMALLFFVIALNLIGVYEFDLINPNWGSKHLKHPALSSFFTGVLAVVVASPCTAPFMGAALGYALSQPGPVLILIFVFLGLGLASPYLMFALAPSLIRFLPKPGAWMKTLKEVMAFPMLLTALWVLWVLAQVGGANAVTMTLALMVGLAFCFWLPKKSLAWILAVLQILAFVAFFDGAAGAKAADSKAPDHAQGPWAAFDPKVLDGDRTQVYFVNFTADWCLSCKVNERTVFASESLQTYFREKNVALMKADWTQRNPEISDFLARYDRIGVPLYLIFPKGRGPAQVLPELVTESLIRERIESLQTAP